MSICVIDPTFRVVLVRDYDRRDYTISASPGLDTWSYWVDREGQPEYGVIAGAEQVLQFKSRLDHEIAHLKTLGWAEPSDEHQ